MDPSSGASCSTSNANALKSLVNHSSTSFVHGRPLDQSSTRGSVNLGLGRTSNQQPDAFFGQQPLQQINRLRANNSFELSQLRATLPANAVNSTALPAQFTSDFEQSGMFDEAFSRVKGKEAMIPMSQLYHHAASPSAQQLNIQQHSQNLSYNPGFQSIRQQQFIQPVMAQLQHRQQHQQNYHDVIALDQAFEEAAALASNTTATPNLQQDHQDWTAEFSQAENQSEINIAGTDASSLLAQTAGHLVQTVDGSTNPKFANSKFLEFMKQIRDQQVGIEGNKVVDLNNSGGVAVDRPPLSVSDDWVKEVGGGLRGSSGWYNGYDEELDFGLTPEQQKPLQWTSDILRSGIEESINERVVNGDYANEEEAAFQEFYNTTGTGNSASRMGSLNPIYNETVEKEWEDMEMSWNMLNNPETSQPVTANRYQDLEFGYTFIPNNPYLTHPIATLKNIATHENLTTSILSLEAACQVDPMDATSWKNLGLRQQENENETAAINALQRAIDLDPTLLDSWIALAVSYTNDGVYSEAYKALEGWIKNNNQYQGLLDGRERGVSQHEFLTSVLIDAVRISGGHDMDTGIQMSLGVLFNISGDHEKAMDCFQACLATHPQDYMLWNKLGATLANSKEPARALEAYRRALELNPGFLRARYNVAVALLQLGQYGDSARHLVSILEAQERNVAAVVEDGYGGGAMTNEERVWQLHSMSSGSTWNTLWMVMDRYLNRPDLAKAADLKNLDAFRNADY
ncbi:UNVERIFIED_CONTAM: hypothetical protein HDU68_004478 [Siphonaria sp. JEL0065]|nr:hypothetical protein HDU68_004478 [Siphonaria sp. JEL0065]